MSTKHLCIGSLALNDTVYADGRTSMADPGGNALYAAAGANIWSSRVGIVAVVGYDWPEVYTAKLEQSTINTAGLVAKDEETLRAWTVYEISGFRRYFSRNTEVALLTPSPFSSSPFSPDEAAAYSEAARQVHLRNSPLPQDLPTHLWNVESIHLCAMRLETTIAWLEYLQDKPEILVSVDIIPYQLHGNFDDPALNSVLKRADVFMPSEMEAESLAPGCHIETFCREIAARGPKVVVVKQGDHGAMLYDQLQDTFCQILPYPAKVNDLTGAGDSFGGGFAIGYSETKDAIKAALYGTTSASFIIEGFGGLHALNVNRSQAEKRLARLQQLNQG